MVGRNSPAPGDVRVNDAQRKQVVFVLLIDFWAEITT